MFGKLINDLVGATTDVAKVAAAPVAVAALVAREVTKPVAEIVEDAITAVRDEKSAKE